MKTKNKVLYVALGIATGVLLFNLGTYVGGEFYHGVQAHNGTTGAIQKVLKNNCNCDAQFELSTFGIHFSKEDGVHGETVAFNLENHTIQTSVEEEALRLNNILKNEVTEYNEIDLLTLNFISEATIETVKFKNGTLLN